MLLAIGRSGGGSVHALFYAGKADIVRESAAALLIVQLLGRVRTADGKSDEVLVMLQRLATLLESYYHPSNSGQ
jgi:hypothetical protein